MATAPPPGLVPTTQTPRAALMCVLSGDHKSVLIIRRGETAPWRPLTWSLVSGNAFCLHTQLMQNLVQGCMRLNQVLSCTFSLAAISKPKKLLCALPSASFLKKPDSLHMRPDLCMVHLNLRHAGTTSRLSSAPARTCPSLAAPHRSLVDCRCVPFSASLKTTLGVGAQVRCKINQ